MMFSLLRGEWFCLWKSTAIRVTFLIVAALSVFMGFYMINGDEFDTYYKAGNEYLRYGGGNLMGQMADSSTCLLVVSLLAGWLISESFDNRTIQGAVSFGKSRAKVYIAKMSMFFLASILFCLVLWLGSSIPVFLQGGLGTPEVVGNLCEVKYIVGMVIAGTMAYMSLFAVCGIIGFFCRKAGAAIGICLLVIVFGVRMFELLLPEALRQYICYTPLGLYMEVLKTDIGWTDIIKTGSIGIVWTVVICGIGLWNFRKTELR